jgi:hypothetical protein
MYDTLTEALDKIINSLDNGLIDDYIFYASKSFKDKIDSYKGVKIVYLNIVQEGYIYYSKNYGF